MTSTDIVIIGGIGLFFTSIGIIVVASYINRWKRWKANKQLQQLVKQGTMQVSVDSPITKYLPLVEKKIGKRVFGLGERNYQQLQQELLGGGRFVVYTFVVSVVFLTRRDSTEVYYIPAGERPPLACWVASICTLVLGWWGIPFGLFYTPAAIISNGRGGILVTDEVRAAFDSTIASLQEPATAENAAY